MKLSEIVAAYMANLPAGIVIDEPAVTKHLKNAVRFYCGYATLASAPPEDDDEDPLTAPHHTEIDASSAIDGEQDFDLTPSEWAIIRPLFDLYVERDNAMHLEASRGLGVDVYGRSSSEVAQDIARKEEVMPKEAFIEAPFTV